MDYVTVIKVFQDDVLIGDIRSDQKHYRSGEEMNWLFEPEEGVCLGITDLRNIANKMESLEPID